MRKWIFSKSAQQDLLAIWSYIARNNVTAADKLESDVYAACNFLEENPGAGHERSDLTPRAVRFWTVRKQYIIVYLAGNQLRIVRVLHGPQDL